MHSRLVITYDFLINHSAEVNIFADFVLQCSKIVARYYEEAISETLVDDL